jgi:hypothetical protein
MAFHVFLGFMISSFRGDSDVAVAMFPSTLRSPIWGDLMLWLGAINFQWPALDYQIFARKRSVVVIPGGIHEIGAHPSESKEVEAQLQIKQQALLRHAFEASPEGVDILLTHCPDEESLCVELHWANRCCRHSRRWTKQHCCRGYSWPTFFLGPRPKWRLSIYIGPTHSKVADESFESYSSRFSNLWQKFKEDIASYQRANGAPSSLAASSSSSRRH